MKRFRGGLVYKARRLLYHSTLGSRVIKKKKLALNGLDREGATILISHNVYIIWV